MRTGAISVSVKLETLSLMSEGGGDEEGGDDGAQTVEFGFNYGTEKKSGGRRAKLFNEQKKKMRTGTFGEGIAAMHYLSCGSTPCRRAESMGLGVPVLRAIKRKGYRLPTPIQRRAMPLIMQVRSLPVTLMLHCDAARSPWVGSTHLVAQRVVQGVDLVGMARTGSGKTAAFVIPMIEKLAAPSPPAGARAIILAPTRELALQVQVGTTSNRRSQPPTQTTCRRTRLCASWPSSRTCAPRCWSAATRWRRSSRSWRR